MPVRYVIDKERRLVITTGEGRVSIGEMKGHQNRLLGDPDFDPSFNQLNDFTTATDVQLSGEEISAFARRDVFSPASRRAIVVSKTLHFGIARQFEMYHGERSIVRVFYDREEALKWLDIPSVSRLP